MFLVVVPMAYAQLDTGPWPMFRHDVKHTGRSDAYGPQSATLLWSYETGGDIESSAAVSGSGRVYIGSEDKALYAFNSDGTLAWTFTAQDRIMGSPAIDGDERIYLRA
jgi:outer membrane protein assembly factor BamB